MKLAPVVSFATEGGPLLLADVASASAWRGTYEDGAGVTVEYMGAATAKFPPELLTSAKPGRNEKKLKTLEEAKQLEAQLLNALRAAYPNAAKHPRYPNQPVYYDGEQRVLQLELKYTSQYQAVCKALKNQVDDIVFDKKKKKAHALFMQQEGGGPGHVFADRDAGVLVVAKPASNDVNPDELLAALGAAKAPASTLQVTLAGSCVLFPAALAWSQLRGPWAADAKPDAAAKALQGAGRGGLHVADQKQPCGAFVDLGDGTYTAAGEPELEVGEGSASVLWLVRA